MSPRQQALVCLAQIRTTFALSTGTCGSPRIRPPILSMNAMRSDDTGRRIRSGASNAERNSCLRKSIQWTSSSGNRHHWQALGETIHRIAPWSSSILRRIVS